MTAASYPETRFILRFVFDGREYVFDTYEIKEVLGDVPMGEPSIIKALTGMAESNITDTAQGASL